ncbi:MAG: hypothetical protein WC734_05565 [Patescibacteria group bacterium]|jgi:hypothetical protein
MAHETGSEHIVNLERFRSALATKAEEYAEASYTTFNLSTDLKDVAHKQELSAGLLQELLTTCAVELQQSPDPDETMIIIKEALVDYQHENGTLLFSDSGKAKFYHDLVIAIARLSNRA